VGLTLYALATDVRMKEPMMAVARKPEPVAPAGPIQRLQVAKLFQENCVACHEVNGTGATIRKALPTVPDFTSLAWQMSQTDVEITHRIQDGQVPLMPAYRDKLSREQILALAIYVRAFSIEPTGPGVTLRDRAQPVAPTPEIRPAESVPERPKPDEKPAPTAAIAKAKPAEPSPAVPAPTALKPEAADSSTVAARMEPAQIFRAYCLACHDTDGRGGLVRKAMTTIPDFTDAKWAASRTDADLQNSILNGKGVFMQPMRDKLGSSDAARMVSFIRELGKANMSVALEPTRPPVAPEAPLPPAAAVAVVESPKPAPVPAPERLRPAVSTPAPTRPAPTATASVAALETSPPPETSERLRAATTLFREYCLSCHGLDGKGNVIRAAMPSIPDFTGAAWQASRSSAELEASVLEGKGTLMPAFRGKIGDDHARDLIAYVRSFGPSQPRRPRSAATTGSFEARYRQLQQQWDELDRQLRTLPPPRQPR
jgi:mono/diheme cytochrome c family protein